MNIKKVINLFLANRALLFLNFCVLCYVAGSARATAITYHLGLFDYALLVLVDHYYVLYCLLPILLVIITKHLRSLSNIEKIRYRNINQMMRVEILSFTTWFTFYLFSSLLIVLLIGLPTFKPNLFAGNFSGSSHNEILLLLREYASFSRIPIVSILAALLYYVFGFTTLTALLSLVNIKISQGATISVAVLILILTFVGFHTSLSHQFPILFLSNYIILHRGLFINGLPSFLLTFLTGLGIILFALGYRPPKLMRVSILNELTISRKMKFTTLLFIICLILIEYFQLVYEGKFYYRDISIRLMLGTNTDFRSFIGWIKTSLVYFLPLFFVGLSVSKIKQYQELPVFMRFESFANLNWKILLQYISYILKYASYLGGFLIAMFLIGNHSSPMSKALYESFGIHLTTSLFMGCILVFIITMMFNLALFLFVSKVTNETAAFVGMLTLSFVNYLVRDLRLLNINPGILTIFEDLQQGISSLYIKIALMTVISICFFCFEKRKIHAYHQTH
jgi:hypothetical protein